MNKKARKATPITVAVAIAIWILAGCASGGQAQNVTSPAPRASAVQVQSPKAMLDAWKKGPGYDALVKLQDDMNAVNDPSQMSPAQAKQLIKDIKTAERYPIPPSVDPGGYYLDALVHLKKGMIAVRNVNVFGAITQMTAGMTSMGHFADEVKKVS